MSTNFLILVRGIPGSGKSTLAANVFKIKSEHIINDDEYWYINGNGSYLFEESKKLNSIQYCLYNAQRLLNNGHNIAVCSPFYDSSSMQPFYHNGQNIHNVPDIQFQIQLLSTSSRQK